MANWISIYQFLISFIFVPLLVVPFIGGTETGITFPEIWTSFRDGALCWLEILPACSGENSRGQLWLLPGFTVVNMSVLSVFFPACARKSFRLCFSRTVGMCFICMGAMLAAVGATLAWRFSSPNTGLLCCLVWRVH